MIFFFFFVDASLGVTDFSKELGGIAMMILLIVGPAKSWEVVVVFIELVVMGVVA